MSFERIGWLLKSRGFFLICLKDRVITFRIDHMSEYHEIQVMGIIILERISDEDIDRNHEQKIYILNSNSSNYQR